MLIQLALTSLFLTGSMSLHLGKTLEKFLQMRIEEVFDEDYFENYSNSVAHPNARDRVDDAFLPQNLEDLRDQILQSVRQKVTEPAIAVDTITRWPWSMMVIPPQSIYDCVFLFYSCTDYERPSWPQNKAKCTKLFDYCNKYIQKNSTIDKSQPFIIRVMLMQNNCGGCDAGEKCEEGVCTNCGCDADEKCEKGVCIDCGCDAGEKCEEGVCTGCRADSECEGHDKVCDNDYTNCQFCNIEEGNVAGSCSPGCVTDDNCNGQCNGNHKCFQPGDNVLTAITFTTASCTGCQRTPVEQGVVMHLLGDFDIHGQTQCFTSQLDNKNIVDYKDGVKAEFTSEETLKHCQYYNLQGRIKEGRITWSQNGTWTLQDKKITFRWSDVNALATSCCLSVDQLSPSSSTAQLTKCGKDFENGSFSCDKP